MELISLSLGLIAGFLINRVNDRGDTQPPSEVPYSNYLDHFFDKPAYTLSRHDYLALIIIPKLYPHLVSFLSEDTHKIRSRHLQKMISVIKRGGIGILPKSGSINVAKTFFQSNSNQGQTSIESMDISQFDLLKKRTLGRHDIHIGSILFMMRDLGLKKGFSAPELYSKFRQKYSVDLSNAFDGLNISILNNRFLQMVRYFSNIKHLAVENGKLYFEYEHVNQNF